ncbi:formate dehydrogenase cytochrome b556 (FDO) subunit [Sulfurimicrobium lacus]|uniref:Formate dehydrogenase cytochrome b556 (FDO) subunit n=1 Tax=Sulfurimicrobium lacus TaxID=2715678 RepID=A0A6F8VDT8_9PROT|nr:formate dehydrogenase subunit gamma [Sulfurimicrobium lacus]BCB27878.1 formate dehydrogenase cytochrome b556 (FDO) subunit [Sulfurimicrobium lacus]
MKRDPKDLVRYSAAERFNHWVVAMIFILLALSGLAFFHPLFFPLTQLFGGGTWARILHPFFGVVMAVSFVAMLFRFWWLNLMTPSDWAWLRRVREMLNGDDHNMPEAGKYNGGQKLLFWLLVGCMALLFVSGIVIWRVYFSATFPVVVVRLAAVVHAASAAVMIALVIVHAYAAIWTKGTIRAMLYGTVSRAWAKQHHPRWFKEVTGEGK